jgi:hypothetical protein
MKYGLQIIFHYLTSTTLLYALYKSKLICTAPSIPENHVLFIIFYWFWFSGLYYKIVAVGSFIFNLKNLYTSVQYSNNLFLISLGFSWL